MSSNHCIQYTPRTFLHCIYFFPPLRWALVRSITVFHSHGCNSSLNKVELLKVDSIHPITSESWPPFTFCHLFAHSIRLRDYVRNSSKKHDGYCQIGWVQRFFFIINLLLQSHLVEIAGVLYAIPDSQKERFWCQNGTMFLIFMVNI